MKVIIASLKKGDATIAPQTTEEAVLVKNRDNDEIITLQLALDNKIETVIAPVGSGLKSLNQGRTVIVAHTNIITPNQTPLNLRIKYDSNGHIIETVPIGNITVKVNNSDYLNTNNSSDQELKFGDDFTLDLNNNIVLKMENL